MFSIGCWRQKGRPKLFLQFGLHWGCRAGATLPNLSERIWSAARRGRSALIQKCDVLVPAAIERVITADNAGMLQCRILAEGANGPTTPEADVVLEQRRDEIFVIPDILCNSGGVIVSYFEWVQDLQCLFWTEAEVNGRLERILEMAFNQVDSRAARDKSSYRTAAMSIGVEKVRAGKQLRGLFP